MIYLKLNLLFRPMMVVQMLMLIFLQLHNTKNMAMNYWLYFNRIKLGLCLLPHQKTYTKALLFNLIQFLGLLFHMHFNVINNQQMNYHLIQLQHYRIEIHKYLIKPSSYIHSYLKTPILILLIQLYYLLQYQLYSSIMVLIMQNHMQ